MKRIFLPLLVVFTALSCQKELSTENGGTVPPPTTDPNNPPIGANCKVQQVLAIDTVTGKGLLSVFTAFRADGIAEKVTVYDSTTSTTEYTADIVYSATGDTVRVGPAEYFVVDANRRVNSFTTIDYSGTTQDTLTYKYSYDGNGYLTSKDLYVSSLPIPLVNFAYTWSGGNLVSVEGNVVIPGVNQKVFESTLDYNTAVTAKNFLPVFPDGFETSLFTMALNLGKVSTNLVSKITATTYDDNGQVEQTLTSEYKNYKFSPDGYLKQWDVSGDLTGGSPFASGRSVFKYFCQ